VRASSAASAWASHGPKSSSISTSGMSSSILRPPCTRSCRDLRHSDRGPTTPRQKPLGFAPSSVPQVSLLVPHVEVHKQVPAKVLTRLLHAASPVLMKRPCPDSGAGAESLTPALDRSAETLLKLPVTERIIEGAHLEPSGTHTP
jgi:hypothetical protein